MHNWNYPDNVTGREPELMGADEVVVPVWCEDGVKGHDENGDEVPCEWFGKIEGEVEGEDFYWTCPRCSTEYVEAGYFEPDPDVDPYDYY